MDESKRNELRAYLRKTRERGIEILERLVSFPSVSGRESDAQNYVSEILENLSFSIDRWEPDFDELKKHPAFLSPRTSFSGSPNVVGVRKGCGQGRSLILNSHIDVVPPGNTGWEHDPWTPVRKGGLLYGRGASDMKGGAAAIYHALEGIRATGIDPRGDIIVESVIEEEAGGAGTLACVLRGYKADAGIVPEPSGMDIYPAAMGSMWFRITVKGKAAHGATAYLGVNPIEKAGTVIAALKRLETERTERNRHPLYTHLPVPFCINIGTLRGGNWPSSVPEEAVMEGRMGVAPSETIEEARSVFEEAVGKAGADDPWLSANPPVVEWFGSCWSSGEIPQNHPAAESLTANIAEVTGKKPAVTGAPWATDAAVLIRYGNTPTIICGPGTGSMAHQTNEYISETDLLAYTEILAVTILDWCGYR